MSVFTCIYVLEESLDPDDVIETLNISDTQKSLKETDERQEESSHEISAMGNTKSVISEREEGEMKSEISADTEKEEKDIDTAVEQVVNIIVDTGDQHEISENMKKENLQMFITPPDNSDIKTVDDDASEKQVPDTNIEQCPVTSPTLVPPESESKSLKSIITENIRIVRKLPSFSHDEISQMSVKLVKEILSESEDDEEIKRRLESLQLIYFTKSDKTEFWSSKEEIMNRIVMDTLAEDEELDEEEEERAAPLSCGPSDDISKENTLTEESTSEGQEDTGCNDNDDSNKSAETQIVDSKDKDELKGTDQMKSSSPDVHENTLTLNDPQENLEQKETLEEDGEVRSDKTIESSADDITQSPRDSNKTDAGVESVNQNTNVENEEVENELSTGKTEDLTESEEERTNLIGIINRNISKLCRQQDYSQNETAQRKVRTLFNIITESTTAEEIYDKIQLEGLQYFAEYQTETDRDEKNENTERDISASKSPSVSRTEKDRDNSIVSKILGEVLSPRQNKPREGVVILDQTEEEMDKKEEEISGEEVVKKEEDIAGEDMDQKEVIAEEDTDKKEEELAREDMEKKEKIAVEDIDRTEEDIAEQDMDKKEEDIAEEDMDKKEEEVAEEGMKRGIGKTLSRDKASRRVRKFVR